MGKTLALIIITTLILTALPIFTATTAEAGEKTLFQIAYDTMEAADAAREKKPWGDVTVFEDAQKELSALGEKSINAQAQSLRGQEGAVAKRRSVK